jgi:protein-S-isoprenylcysteine O-methyltransferase Ste14
MLRGVAGRERPSDVRWLLVGYAGLAGFFALEAVLRRPGNASSLDASDADRGTTRLIVGAYAVAVEVPLLARGLPTRSLPRAVAPVGFLVQAAGLALRAWSMRSLGTSYSRTLRTDGDQQVLVESGPYRLIRHPGYAGSLLTWIGFAVTSRSVPVTIVVPGLLGAAYIRRIEAEEELLRRDLPGYATYSERTMRLIPLVW